MSGESPKVGNGAADDLLSQLFEPDAADAKLDKTETALPLITENQTVILPSAKEDDTSAEQVADEKISFFDTGAQAQTVLEPAPLEAVEDQTILLQPVSAVASTPSPVPDLTDQTQQDLKLEPLETIEKNDLADAFIESSVKIVEVKVSSKPRLQLPKIPIKSISGGLAVLLLVVGVGFSFFRLKSKDGILGLRLDGAKFVKAYRAPNNQTRAEFEKVFQSVKEAVLSGSPTEMASAMGPLKTILEKDPLNVEAVSGLIELSGALLYWYGPASPWAARMEEFSQKLTDMTPALPNPPSPSELAGSHRGRAWKSLALANEEGASTEASQAGLNDDRTIAIMSEIALRRRNLAELGSWVSKASAESRKLDSFRFFADVAQKDEKDLETLAASNYLPARIWQFVNVSISTENAASQLKKSEDLLSLSQDYPRFQKWVREYRGDIFAFQGDEKTARDDWKLVVEKFPKEQAVWMKLASSYEEAAQWDNALDAYRSAEKAGKLSENLLLNYARLLHLRGRVVDALTLLDRGITDFPKATALLYEKARVQLTIYQDDAAKTSFEKALNLDPQFEPATLGLADLAFQHKQWHSVDELLKKIPGTSSNYPLALQRLGWLAEIEHDFNRAEGFYKRALEANSKLETVYSELVRIDLNGEKDEDALAMLQQGLHALPHSALLKVGLVKVYQFQGNFKDALALVHDLLKTHEHLKEVQFTAIDVLLDHHDYEEAWSLIQPLVTKELRDAELSYLKAKAYWLDPSTAKSVGSYEAAFRLIDSAIHQDPESEKYHLLAAEIALKLQERGTALENAEAVLKNKSDSAAAHVLKGDIQFENGEYEKATKEYQLAMESTRFHSRIWKKLGESYRAIGKPALAIENYKKVVQESPNDVQSLLILGKLLNQAGHYGAATETLTRALKLDPKLAEAHYTLGFIQKELGERKAAISSFEKYLSLDPKSDEAQAIRDEIFFLKRRMN